MAKVVRALQHYPIQQDWTEDPTIMAKNQYPAGFNDFHRSTVLLRALIEKQYTASRMDGVASTESGPNRFSLIEFVDERLGDVTLSNLDTRDGTETISYYPSSLGESENAVPEYDAASDTTVVQLPPGKIDDETKQGILDAQCRTPHYLFRAWNNSKDPSGGTTGLNTTKAITPLAFHNKTVQPDATILDLSRHELAQIVKGHLTGTHHPKTQLSSWAASPQVAFRFTKPDIDGTNRYISIIDTQNIIIHIPTTKFLGGSCGGYAHEYLAYGIVEDRAHQAIPLEVLNEIDVGIGGALKTDVKPERFCVPDAYPRIMEEEFQMAKKVAQNYGKDFVVAVTIAILCQKQRDGDCWRCGEIKELEMIAQGLKDYEIPENWCENTGILTDIVYVEGYGGIEQIVHLLRALVNYWHGKCVRSCSRSVFLDAVMPDRVEKKRKRLVHFEDEMEEDEKETSDEERRGRRSRRGRHW